jgi:radical SAM superfamily enzyme with C-terminal helix-hairpin-helix motif
MWGSIIGVVTKSVGGYFKGKQELAGVKLKGQMKVIEAEAESKLAIAKGRVRMAEEGQAQSFNLDLVAMNNMEKSYKDEIILIVFMTPMVLAFIPSMDVYALRGFEVIEKMPQWYQYILIGMIVVIYGMRGMLDKLLSSKVPSLK